MKDTGKYKEKDLDEIASRFDGKVDVDAAWGKLYNRISEAGMATKTIRITDRRTILLRIAAVAIVLLSIGSVSIFLVTRSRNANLITVESGTDERNREVILTDGSKVWLNRSSKLTYSAVFSTETRNVRLKGEAFFDIAHDPSKPFIIDAGKANIRVLGTSFNVITDNVSNQVEVYVRTGKVILTNNYGEESVILEPGYIGTAGTSSNTKALNENRNYLAWKTDTLVYNGETLDIVFSDLKRVFNINISTSDTSISNKSLTTTFFSLPQETIIQLICNTFSLNYTKEGDVYRLSR